MGRTSSRAVAEPVAAKVPEVTALFWAVKLLTTGVGEAAADSLAQTNLLLAAAVGFTGFGVAMRWQLRARTFRPGVYWFAVSMVAVFGTMGADAAHILFKLPYVVSTLLCAVSLVIVFRWWRRSEGTLSIHSIVTRRRERFYWLAVLATFAMGTALGDLTATTLHLGFLGSIVLFAALITVPALGWWRLGWNPVASFWFAYVLTRPLGASIADWLGKPRSFGHGLGLGDGWVAMVGAGMIVIVVAWMIRNRYGIQTAADAGATGQERLLYHFTTDANWTASLEAGQVAPTPLLGAGGALRNVPPVVWLSDDPSGTAEIGTAETGTAQIGTAEIGTADIRLLVCTDRATRWDTWTYIHRISRRLREDIDRREGRHGERAWLVTGGLYLSSVLRVERRAPNGQWQTLDQAALDQRGPG